MLLPSIEWLASVSAEAVREHGGDWDRVDQAIRSKLATLSPSERAALDAEIYAAGERKADDLTTH